MHDYDVIVIGGGPAGLAAALAANENGARVLVVEREERLGGMLKQCIHDGFGLRRFGERLAGPEYVERFMDKIAQSDIEAACNTFVTRAEKTESGFAVTLVSREGLRTVTAKSLVLATGCRERSAKQVFIHGRVRQECSLPAQRSISQTVSVSCRRKKCVILGLGDIGLIMARRLTLEGVESSGVYEINPTPSG
ncbi:MAG: FAD-dependent oxidoreductase, partial [Oscillospiraceae bacterium]